VARFDEAINRAAALWRDDGADERQRPQDDVLRTHTEEGVNTDGPYVLVRAHNVGYTAILLFAKDPARVRDLQEAEVGFGAAEMGNKGAVGLRVLYDAAGKEGDETQSTELTFVATHLAAMEWNLPRRNANWAAIMRGLTFDNPEAVVERMRSREGTSSDVGGSSGEDEEENGSNIPLEFIPGPEELLDRLVPKYVETLLFRALVESAAGEHGARMSAMKSATDAANEMSEDLKQQMNKARQAAITAEIIEIAAAAEALGG